MGSGLGAGLWFIVYFSLLIIFLGEWDHPLFISLVAFLIISIIMRIPSFISWIDSRVQNYRKTVVPTFEPGTTRVQEGGFFVDQGFSIGDLISIIISIIYLVFSYLIFGFTGVISMVAFLILPLSLIWYSEEMGMYKGGFLLARPIPDESPSYLVSLMGWILLLLPVVIWAIFFIGGISWRMVYKPF